MRAVACSRGALSILTLIKELARPIPSPGTCVAGLSLVNLALFVWVASNYRYKSVQHKRRAPRKKALPPRAGRGVPGAPGGPPAWARPQPMRIPSATVRPRGLLAAGMSRSRPYVRLCLSYERCIGMEVTVRSCGGQGTT